ncbi:NAD(P)-binding protein [Lojkania enalia]|uniref:NAD(P)-binding protein n=1 Tax=Lojkania enalia TaxID=147567 RepID=A0A9P4TPM9_9PLEO|nr:NAD(P)-binding protein [Didymosphaeria enalia]
MSFPAPTATWHRKPYPTIDPSRPELSAKGKNIVITGGGSGIGAETARYFAKAGASRILIIGRREASLLSTKISISKESPRVNISFASADILKKTEIDAAFAEFCKGGKIDVLVSNAGVGGLVAPIKDADPDEWFSGIETNMKGSFIVVQSFLGHAAPGAVVINITSAVWYISISGTTSSYGAAKAGSLRLFHALAHEHPELTVYNLQPGYVLTDGAKSVDEGFQNMTLEKEEALKLITDEVGLPAAYCVWLASPEATFLKGKFMWSNWDVDELKERRSEIKAGWLDIGPIGWPFA